MKKNNLIFMFLVAVQIFGFCACVCVQVKAPYFAAGEFVFRQERLVFAYDFLNENSGAVEKVDFVVCVADSADEDDFSARRFFASCKICVPPGGAVHDYFEVQDFFVQVDSDEELPEIESFYAEKIYYSDGTFFEDPFGRFSR